MAPKRQLVVYARDQLEMIGSGGGERARPFVPPAQRQTLHPFTNPPVAGVDQDPAPGFRVRQLDQAGIGHRLLSPVIDRDRHDLMPGSEPPERTLPVVGQKVGENDDDAAVPEQAAGVGETRREVGGPTLGLERDEVADDPERVPPSLAWRNDVLDLVGEEQRADPVVLEAAASASTAAISTESPLLVTGSPNRVDPD